MDTAKEMDDNGARRRIPGAALPGQAVGQQNTKTRTRVEFHEKKDGFSGFLNLL